MSKGILDYVLVPAGLLVMIVYHMWLLRRIIRRPATTVLGVNAINRRLWVRTMMEDTGKNGIIAVQTLRNSMMASTLLATMMIMLSSVIAVLMSSSSSSSSGGDMRTAVASTLHPLGPTYENKSELWFSLKFFLIQVCFLSAFLMNVLSIRFYNHASMLINVPSNIRRTEEDKVGPKSGYVTFEYVSRAVNRGSLFWSFGLRTVYFSLPLFLWIFGPIPMFFCCVLLVVMLYFLDVILESSDDNDDDNDKEDHSTNREDVISVVAQDI